MKNTIEHDDEQERREHLASIPTLFRWKDRDVKLEDGCWMMSRVGDYEDFDFAPEHPSPGMAVAGSLGGPMEYLRVAKMFLLDADRLLLMAEDGSLHVMIGDPMAGGRISLLAPVPVSEDPFNATPLEMNVAYHLGFGYQSCAWTPEQWRLIREVIECGERRYRSVYPQQNAVSDPKDASGSLQEG